MTTRSYSPMSMSRVKTKWEAQKPYFHPLRTLAGDVLTNFRPNDHRWHHGMCMTFAYVSGDNFWGGNTFVEGKGYTPLDNIGHQYHQAWETIYVEDDRLQLVERLHWLNHTGETWIDETRRISVPEINAARGYWRMDVSLSLLNVRGETLVFGSPATQGRPDGVGYGGWYWRGARDLTNALVMVADGLETRKSDMEVMGHHGPWLAFVGKHDVVDRESTVIFIDQPQNPRYPNRCSRGQNRNVGGQLALTYDSVYSLQSGESLDLSYRMIFSPMAHTRVRRLGRWWMKQPGRLQISCSIICLKSLKVNGLGRKTSAPLDCA